MTMPFSLNAPFGNFPISISRSAKAVTLVLTPCEVLPETSVSLFRDPSQGPLPDVFDHRVLENLDPQLSMNERIGLKVASGAIVGKQAATMEKQASMRAHNVFWF